MQSKLSVTTGPSRRSTNPHAFSWRYWIAASWLFAALLPLPTRADVPARVVSANLCADQLLLALADPGQIVSLSPFAADPTMSYLSEKAEAYPRNRGSGEDLVRLQADLVLVGPFDSRYTKQLLTAHQTAFLILPPWSNLAEGRQQIRDIAARLGYPERGERLIREIDGALGQIRNIARSEGRKPTSLIVHRRGFVFHAGITGEIADLAGFADSALALGVKGAGFVQLERLLTGRPDYLVVAGNGSKAEDQGEAILVHPALLALFPLDRRLVIPDRLTICGGPSTPDLIRRLMQEINEKVMP